MTDRKSSRFQQAAGEIDLKLGDLLGHLGEALDEITTRLSDEEGGEIRRERQFDTGSGPIRATAGVTIRTLGGSATTTRTMPERRPDQPIRPQKKPAAPDTPPEPRRVEATVFEEAGQWSLVADMPGVSNEGVSWQVDGDTLRIDGKSAARHYRVETTLPAELLSAEFAASVQNGILDMTVKEPEA